MDSIQAVQAKMLDEIKEIDGGWTTLAKKMGISDAALHKTVIPKEGRKPRLATLEKVKQGIRECMADQEKQIADLLA